MMGDAMISFKKPLNDPKPESADSTETSGPGDDPPCPPGMQ